MDNNAEKLTRPNVANIDSILGVRFPVLDGGFVRAVDYMGSDHAVVQAARISYGAGTKQVHEDRGLIRYLMRHRHTTPFEMCEIKLHVRVPMDCWRQWIRHRMANVNEYSTRYSEAIDATHRTGAGEWRSQSTSNRQGSEATIAVDIGQRLSARELELQRMSREIYEERVASGVAREQARKDLPLSTYTEAYWKIDLHNLLHFLSLRMDAHAQHEIRAYAMVIGEEIVAKWCPQTWEAFVDYRMRATNLSRLEMEVIGLASVGDSGDATEFARSAGWLEEGPDGRLKRNREREECESKFCKLGIAIPWIRD